MFLLPTTLQQQGNGFVRTQLDLAVGDVGRRLARRRDENLARRAGKLPRHRVGGKVADDERRVAAGGGALVRQHRVVALVDDGKVAVDKDVPVGLALAQDLSVRAVDRAGGMDLRRGIDLRVFVVDAHPRLGAAEAAVGCVVPLHRRAGIVARLFLVLDLVSGLGLFVGRILVKAASRASVSFLSMDTESRQRGLQLTSSG